jgi:predicted O-linked N-acetylglucosamine transferase (SPINDLY family)
LNPLASIAFFEAPDALLKSATIWTAHECPPWPQALWQGERYDHERIRIAYVSADFRIHAVAQLAAGVFEQHDRTRFETNAISLASDDRSPIRRRLEKSFDRFIDAHDQSDADVAKLLRDMEIDIAVDIMGFTQGARSTIFGRRPAGIQVNYLGFPGTMGAPYMDYILADKTIIPEESRAHFAETVVYLPHSYMPNDSKRAIGQTPSRAEAGLPQKGFVFCTFNNLFKITPGMFDIWMRLLLSVEGSVLWLSQPNSAAIRNLKREAEARGISGTRILFAPFVTEPGAHLARLSLADLFLDTLPYNSHSTACDALWAGVPLVTLEGTSFAGRVGASLLSAIGLSELIAHSASEYEGIALRLARDSVALESVKEKLARNRVTHPLFDTARFTRNLEAAYVTMWERHQRSEPPVSFAVSDTATP